VKLLTALPDPPLFRLIATLACLFGPIATATIDLCAAPNCWIRFEETDDEFEDVDRGCNANECSNHVVPPTVDRQ
jgi:hypothetical protein